MDLHASLSVGPTEFHVSRAARERYGFDERLFALNGNVVFADFAASRRFAQKMNAARDLAADPGNAVRAGDLNAMGLIDEVLHHVVELYRKQVAPNVLRDALATLQQRLGRPVLDAALLHFVEHFPGSPVYRQGQSPAAYLRGRTDGRPNREIVLEELLMLWLANMNPGFAPYGELFDDRPLEEGSAYEALIRNLVAFTQTQPPFGPDNDDLITLLRRPALEAGDSLQAQLRWLRERWGFVMTRFGDRLLIGLDVLAEEERAVWMRFHPTAGGADSDAAADAGALHGFGGLDEEPERFSQDLDWMPRLVLIAKSTYVWLDQLARQYNRPVWRLDQIPDEELDRLARAGFTGLWLIGLWERSHASQRIKQLRGQPDAVASAYSLMDYRIAADLGGDEAYSNLRDRAAQRGIRLASDMVPNHMGIDSRWVIEHPDWFVSRADPPYPAYSYEGPNLSADERVGIYLEDHYYDNTDAAVTFKRVDRWSGEARYVYHGNDGTSTPWNDTAQLDYLSPEVREAVIQTILSVARRFPVIRFDAAMTLAKKHIARLWYPQPGEGGGAIPSRAEYSMTKRALDRAMPQEFWREVVDRVAAEAPDTLLLAEAFWLMEGYFVRTLGMHRVYNSAFMNMLRDEKNAEYRLVIKNTLEFDPQILKRYVNFMNNPDEKTAVEQFGSGDKYFGVATVMATMPGLPMFGHGQIEGLTEKYGMEYRRARLDEQPNDDLIARHEREIFPLLHRRELFAESADFALYDFYTADGGVNEDVFAYSNRRGDQRSLVVYHNRYAETRGSIRAAAVTGRSIADELRLAGGHDQFLLMRDMRSGLEYVRNQQALALDGMYLELDAYRCHVFADLRDVQDTDGRWARLADWLGGSGVPSLEQAMREMELAPFHDALRHALDEPGTATVEALPGGGSAALPKPTPAAVEFLGRRSDAAAARREYRAWLVARAIDDELTSQRSPLAGGRWIREWLAERALPNAETLAALLAVTGQAGGDGRGTLPAALLRDDRVARAIGVNEHDGVAWFNRERWEQLATWLQVPAIERGTAATPAATGKRVDQLVATAERAGYRLDALGAALGRRRSPKGGSADAKGDAGAKSTKAGTAKAGAAKSDAASSASAKPGGATARRTASPRSRSNRTAGGR